MEKSFSTWVNEELKIRGWSMNQLAGRADISQSSLSMALSGQKPLTWKLCHAVALALDASPVSVFRRAGLLPQENVGLKAKLINTCGLLIHDEDMELAIAIIKAIHETRKKRMAAAV